MLTIQFLCPLPNGPYMLVRRGNLKSSAASGKREITFINHRQNAKADAKSSLALIGTGTLFNDSCSLNISGSDEEQARRVLEEYIQVRFIDSDSVQPTLAELTAHPLPSSLSRLNPDLLYGNVLASGVGVGTLTLFTERQPRQLSGDSLRVRKIPPYWSTVWQRLPSN
ncbi:multiphosphoryl transfer protein 1 [includes phosphoenolpyruvate-protein phosphotransferase;phosphocarrier protein Hp; fructose-like phosphotransferase enzyme IIA component] [Escherichia coli]|uniref:Multiphosphoryl transfer protein 1 [includes phosphoenolpyruvate-protein phosphotransferasephosphocarrier protein Hp fructose-like phosphotransferase enzyme IIA component] n=1 Tax=Escherichia coli TaxID=562 RepID=A0A484WZZ1_ECOLX|nr:multiphosphoryl transfer protein 1 [includes phosphoenolpyruvate-protein phosphotransferase;phosphocarrier protein Hp; fructose-like phosphotransferase enzyme IIA component] [Escherichia coli]